MARSEETICLNKIKTALLCQGTIKIVASNCDCEQILSFIASANPNDDPNVFPDFVFNNGGIEHFQIDSSKETKKGSEFIRDEKANQRVIEEDFLKQKELLTKDKIHNNESRVITYSNEYNYFSYGAFLKSLERNINRHVKSLNKQGYQNKTVIFLMDQQSARLSIFSKYRTFKEFYILSKDRTALNIIKKICVNVDYLIYIVADAIELIDLSKIDELINNSIIYEYVDGGILKNKTVNFL